MGKHALAVAVGHVGPSHHGLPVRENSRDVLPAQNQNAVGAHRTSSVFPEVLGLSEMFLHPALVVDGAEVSLAPVGENHNAGRSRRDATA